MTNSKSTKRALTFSALAILMCVAMLIGTTFAWFTDTATTGINKITSGNLYIEIQDKDGKKVDTLEWVDEDGKAIEKQEDILWEPGCTYLLTPFRIANTGNLALKYKIVITGLDGDSPLLDVIKFTYKIDGVESKLDEEGHLKVGETTKMITVSAHMDTAAGNDYMNKTLTGIKFNVYATQDTVESDSYGPDYDKAATYPVSSQSDFDKALDNTAEGGTIVIPEDVSINLDKDTKIGNGIKIEGAGAGKTTLNSNNTSIKNDDVTIKNVSIKGNGSQGTGGTLNISGNNTSIENVDYKGDGNIAIAVSTGANNSGTVFKNTKITDAFRGIQFWSLSGNSMIDNCVLDISGYTFNIDSAVPNSTLTLKNSTLNGWTSYTSGIKLVSFENCKLGKNTYAFLRPYSETKLTKCEFTADDYQLNAGGSEAYTITLTDCTKNGTPITADNVKSLLLDMDDWNSKVTLVVNGVTVK